MMPFEETLHVLRFSRDAMLLLRVAVELALSPEPQRLEALQKALTTESFLYRLDSREDYVGRHEWGLQLRPVLQALATNSSGPGRRCFDALLESAVFTADPSRIGLLLRVSEHVRPPSVAVLRFWSTQMQPGDDTTGLAMTAIFRNGDASGLEIAERQLRNPAYEDGERQSWLIGCYVPARNQASVLALALRMLETGVGDLAPILVERTFDYRRTWFGIESRMIEPDRLETDEEARALLRRIAAWARANLELPERTEAAMARTLEIIGPPPEQAGSAP